MVILEPNISRKYERFELFNLGTNEGTTVLQLINAFNQVTQSNCQ